MISNENVHLLKHIFFSYCAMELGEIFLFFVVVSK